MTKPVKVDFFMGANSSNGFYSYYDELRPAKTGFRSFLIKGGSGTGKSGLMKKIANTFVEQDNLTEYIHCSSDPDSLDGVILHKGKCSVVDATPPHVIEPDYPGGYETVINICEFFDEDKLESRLDKTVYFCAENSKCHAKCRKLIHCAEVLLTDNASLVKEFTDFDKVIRNANRVCHAEIPKKKDNSRIGDIKRRLLTAVTNKGILTYEDTIPALCDEVVLIKDSYSVASVCFLEVVRDYAISNGYDVYCCYSPLDPVNQLEHVLIPEMRLGFVTSNSMCEFEQVNSSKIINFSRFTDMVKLADKKQYLKFNKKMAFDLLEQAVVILKDAKDIHDDMEIQYTDAVDFSRLDEKSDEVIAKINSRYF